jgi:prepilin-type N-terminal cleavage/methylation domain-containing protein
MPRTRSSHGFTLLEVIFVTAVIALLSAIAIPTVFRSRLAANETSAIGTLHGIHTAQLTYALTCGYGLFSSSFPAFADPNGDGFLPDDLTASPVPVKSGYAYQVQPGQSGPSGLVDCNGFPTGIDYYVTAVPVTFQSTGNRAFASSQGITIWQDTSGLAPVEPFVAAGTVTSLEQ